MKDGIWICICTVIITTTIAIAFNTADATPVKGCAQYNDGCWCIVDDTGDTISVDDGHCQESFDEEEVQMMIGWLIAIGVIHQMINTPDPGLGILPPQDDRRWDIQSSPDGVAIEYAIPF